MAILSRKPLVLISSFLSLSDAGVIGVSANTAVEKVNTMLAMIQEKFFIKCSNESFFRITSHPV
jgi:hypothetical protein